MTSQQVQPAESPIDNWKTVVTQRYAQFDGRARRAEYWWFFLINIVIYVGIGVVTAILGAISDSLAIIGLLAYVGFGLAMLIPGLALAVRRLHDTNKSAWFLLIALIPFVGGLILLVFMLIDGDREANTYGPSPKYIG